MALKFYNTFTRTTEEFVPLNKGKVGIYTCGPTVYNFAHIGNFRAYTFEDILRKTIKYLGFELTQVMNLTDVDDKTIRGSCEAGMPLSKFTETYKKAFFEDINTLRIEKAEYYPEATAHIPEMISMIETLIQKGIAYQAEDKSVYFSVAKFANYGKLARIDMQNQRAGQRVRNDEYSKESASDFALWKAWDKDDGEVFWESPWGKGRPGWHIECSAMSMKYLGKTFDIHTGGIDNMFPHHEDEIAQSESANGCKFVNYWLHCEHLIVDGQKMSKSFGNFYTLRDILQKGYSGREVRWVLMGIHYRKKLNFGFSMLDSARATLKRFDAFFERLKAEKSSSSHVNLVTELSVNAKKSFREALEDDLNISEALAAIYRFESESSKMLENGQLGKNGAEIVLNQFRDFDKVLSVFSLESVSCDAPDYIRELSEKRLIARKNKDFKLADEIRAKVNSEGWIIEDTPSGTRLIKK